MPLLWMGHRILELVDIFDLDAVQIDAITVEPRMKKNVGS